MRSEERVREDQCNTTEPPGKSTLATLMTRKSQPRKHFRQRMRLVRHGSLLDLALSFLAPVLLCRPNGSAAQLDPSAAAASETDLSWSRPLWLRTRARRHLLFRNPQARTRAQRPALDTRSSDRPAQSSMRRGRPRTTSPNRSRWRQPVSAGLRSAPRACVPTSRFCLARCTSAAGGDGTDGP